MARFPSSMVKRKALLHCPSVSLRAATQDFDAVEHAAMWTNSLCRIEDDDKLFAFSS